MDNLAHTLIGIGVARSGLSKRFGPGTTFTVALASNLPDVDALYAFWDGWDRFMLRRTHTHALLALPVLAAGLAWLLRFRYPGQSWRALFGLSALGIALHLLFDLVNSFGVVLLWPFDRTRFELASIFIIDLAIWAITIAPLVAGRFLADESTRQRGYRISVALLAAYTLTCVLLHARAESLVRSDLAARGVQAESVRVFPEPLGPWRFRSATLTGSEWSLRMWRVFPGTGELLETRRSDRSAPRVQEVRASPKGRQLEWFMAAPVWTLRPDGGVDVEDLRFGTVVVRRPNPFVVTFPPGSLDALPRP